MSLWILTKPRARHLSRRYGKTPLARWLVPRGPMSKYLGSQTGPTAFTLQIMEAPPAGDLDIQTADR